MPEHTADLDSDNGHEFADSLTDQMDRLSLEQALRDFEIANARVLDLTQRLITATQEINQLRHQYESLRIEHGIIAAEHNQILSSRAYQFARLVGQARRALRA